MITCPKCGEAQVEVLRRISVTQRIRTDASGPIIQQIGDTVEIRDWIEAHCTACECRIPIADQLVDEAPRGGL